MSDLWSSLGILTEEAPMPDGLTDCIMIGSVLFLAIIAVLLLSSLLLGKCKYRTACFIHRTGAFH